MLRDSKGGLSITALWILALLSLLTAGLVRNAVVGLRLESYTLRATEAVWLARAGVYQAIAVLKSTSAEDTVDSYHAFTQAWAYSPALFKQIRCGVGFFEVGYSNESGRDDVRQPIYGVCDENRKININHAPAEALLRLPGMKAEKVAALMDWRDEDNETRPGGAEANYYEHNASYPCKNGKFDFVEELRLVKGFNEEEVRQLAPWITVHGDGKVNINTAPAEVLSMLGIRKEVAKAITKVRQGHDDSPFTGDDIAFKVPGDLVTQLNQLIKLKPSDQVLLNRLVSEGSLGVQSTHFTIHAVGVTLNGLVRKMISVTVQRLSDREVQIVAWNEQ
ncbi:MAG: general secretion pathway protein GspK [bacterium]